MENRERVFYAMGCHPNFDQQVIQWVNHLRSRSRTGVTAPSEFVALDHLLHDLRVYKSKAELKGLENLIEIYNPIKSNFVTRDEIKNILKRQFYNFNYFLVIGNI